MNRRKFSYLRERLLRTVPDAERRIAEERERALAEIERYEAAIAERKHKGAGRPPDRTEGEGSTA
jgi:hypothetical protein